MGRFYNFFRPLSMVLLTGMALETACFRGPLGNPSQDGTEPACVWLAGARINRADGSSTTIRDPVHQRSGTACLCIKDAPYAVAEFPAELKDAFNDAALEECLRLLVAYYPDAESDNCEEIYEAGNWKNNIVRPVGLNANAMPPGFHCGGR